MTNKQQGFTLIELVAVIVILGALAVVALPRFVNLQDEADEAALEGVAGGMASAMAINFAGCIANNHNTSSDDCVTISSCSDVANILQGGIPDGYSVSFSGGSSIANVTNGVEGECTVTQDNSSLPSGQDSMTFQGITAGL